MAGSVMILTSNYKAELERQRKTAQYETMPLNQRNRAEDL